MTATDARGHTSTFTYDATGLLTSEVQPTSATNAITTTFGYDAAGNRTRFTDGRSNPFITTYNTWNLPENLIEPSTPTYPNPVDRTFTTVYDPNGQVAKQVSPGGVSVTNTYNTVGNLTKQTGAGADAATTDRVFGYDLAGRLTTASAPGGTDTFGYDDRDLLLSATGPSGNSSFTYNGDGLMSTRTDAAGTATYTYDTADRLATLKDASTGTTAVLSYNTLSQPNKITYGTGADTRSFGYNNLHQLTSDTVKTSANATVGSIAYGYDLGGNLTSKNTVGFAGAGNNTYTYDYADRLASWTSTAGTSTYGYDASGNRTQSGAQTFTYNARNQLTTGAGTTYTYTPRGTLATAVTGSTTVTSKNDAFGQTINQGNQTYTYDALGRTVTDATSGGTTRTFAYTGMGNDVASDGSSTYSRGPGGALTGIKTGTTSWLAWTDRHSDLVAAFVANGTTLAGSTTYGPLGTTVASTTPKGNLGYQSGWTETTTGRVNMAARWYNTATGQFDNRDTATNNPTPNSAAANRYAYGNANPLNSIDPDGHRVWDLSDTGRVVMINTGPPVSSRNDPGPCHSYNLSSASCGAAPMKAGSPNPYTVTKKNEKDCGQGDWRCRQRIEHQIADALAKAKQKADDAFDNCPDIKCQKRVLTKERDGAYSLIDNGDGTYTTTNGKDLVIITDENQVRAIAAQHEAEAKAAACKKDLWCSAKQWVKDHASQIVGTVVSFIASAIVTYACNALTRGVIAPGCLVLGGAIGGAIGGLVTHAMDVSAGRADGGSAGYLKAGVAGAVEGGIGAWVGGKIAGKVGQAILSKFGVSALSTASRVGVKAAAGAISGGVTGALLGAGFYGAGCATGSECTAAGFAGAVGAGAAIGAATGAVGGAAAKTCHSFDPVTPVLMADGSARPIKDIKIGDNVTATDPLTGKTIAQPVTTLHLNHDTDLTDVTISAAPVSAATGAVSGTFAGAGTVRGPTNTLHTTAHHPFWDATNQQWINAADLQPGHQLTGPNGQVQYVTAVHNYVGAKDMRDLTVATVHTYYVMAGTAPVLVHNEGGNSGWYSSTEVDLVERHLSTLDPSSANDEMITRIRTAIANGEPLRASQQYFMNHELAEANLMAQGMSYENAHQAALQTHPAGQNYDVDIIDKDPSFGPWWRKQNGLLPRC